MTYRSQFILPEGGPYLLAHAAGALPVSTQSDFAAGYFEPWAQGGNGAWGAWLGHIDGFRNALSTLLGGHMRDFCPKPNLSAALFSVLSGLKKNDKKNVILASAHMFASLGFVAQKAKALGFELRLLNETLDPSGAAVWINAMSDDVCVIIAMHVHSNNGLVSPVQTLCDNAREKGIFSIIDVAQSAGVMPITLNDWRADVVIGSCLKWLCGGPGAGFMWVNPNIINDLTPIDIGWFSHENPFEFDIGEFRYAPDALRFWGGTPSIAPYIIATTGVNLINEIGVDKIHTHNRALTNYVCDNADEHWRPQLDLKQKGGTMCIKAGEQCAAISAKLNAYNCHFDTRSDVVRLSFHLWNDENDAKIVADCLR